MRAERKEKKKDEERTRLKNNAEKIDLFREFLEISQLMFNIRSSKTCRASGSSCPKFLDQCLSNDLKRWAIKITTNSESLAENCEKQSVASIPVLLCQMDPRKNLFGPFKINRIDKHTRFAVNFQ